MTPQTPGRPGLGRQILGWALLVLVVVLILLGAYLAVKLIIAGLVALFSRVSIWPTVGGFLKSVVLDHLDGWVVAIATGFIAYFTIVLSKESKRQTQGARPFLFVVLTEEAQSVPTDPDYQFGNEDAADGHLVQSHNSVPNARYVSMEIHNEQATPLGIAADVYIELTLGFGVNDNVTPYPHSLPRVVYAPVVGASKMVSGRVFNVAGLTNYTILVTGVTYKDISGIKRSAGYGIGRVYKRVGAQPFYQYTAFRTRKREIIK